MFLNPSILSECDGISLSQKVDSDRTDNQDFSEKGGINNIRPDLKTAAIAIFPESIEPLLDKAQSEKGLFCFLDWMRFNGYATESQWRSLNMLVFAGRAESYWANRDVNIKPHPGHRGYPCVDVGELGTKLAWRVDTDDNGVRTYQWDLTLPGKALEGMGFEQVIKFLERLSAYFPDLNPTRFDFTVEDYTKSLPIDEMVSALNDRNYRGFQKKAIILSDSKGKEWDGFTANLGSRESDSYTRVYDTGIKHGYPAIRVEREVKGDLLKAYWQDIKQIIYENRWTIKGIKEKIQAQQDAFYADLIQKFAAIAVSGFDFIDRSKILDSGSLEKCPLLPFWLEFKAKIGEWKKTVKRAIPTLKSTHDWLYRQVKKTLAVMRYGLTDMDFIEMIDRFVKHGKQDFTAKDVMNVSILQDKGLFAFMGINISASESEIVHTPIAPSEGLSDCVPY